MINLLPIQEQKQIRAGRANVILRRYFISSVLFIALLAGAAAGFYLMLMQSKANAENEVNESRQKIAEYQPVQKEITAFKNNLSIGKTILNSEIHYSKIIPAIARTIPAPMKLAGLEIGKESFGGELSLTVYAFSEQDAVTLKTALEKETDLFQNVYLDSVQINRGESKDQSDAATAASDGYPAVINIKVTLKPEVAKL